MLNAITVMGRITHDLTLTEGDTPRLGFRIACDRDGGREKKTDFLDCTAFGKTAEFISRFFSKGRPILIQGRLQIDDWQDRSGNKRRDAKIIVLNAHFCGDGNKTAAPTAAPTPTPMGKVQFTAIDEADSDLPF